MRLPLFSQRLTAQPVLQHRLGQQLLQPRVLRLERFEPLRIRHIHAAVLASPEVIARLREPVATAQILDRYTALRFTETR